MAENEFRKSQRENTIKVAVEAAERLQEKGVGLTFRAIAEEAGLSHATLLQPEVKVVLYEKFQFSRGKKNEDQKISILQSKIKELEKSLVKSRKVNADLRKQCKLLQQERDKFEKEYRYLLLQYAINIDKKIQPI